MRQMCFVGSRSLIIIASFKSPLNFHTHTHTHTHVCVHRRILWLLSKVMAVEELLAFVAGMFYQTVVGAVFLYKRNLCSLSPTTLEVIESFHV